MAIKTVIITTVERVKSQSLTLAWPHPLKPGKTEYISSMWTVEEVKTDDPESRITPQIINITKERPRFTLSYEESAKPGTADHHKKLAIAKIKTLSVFTVNGEATENTRNPQFNIEDVTDSESIYMQKWERKLECANFIKKATDTVRRDVCYYFGFPVKDKTPSEVLKLLADFGTGVVLGNDKNIEVFMKLWSKDKDDERDYKIAAEKAVALNIIIKRDNGTSKMYYYGQNPVGVSLDDVIAYFRKNDKIFTDNILVKIAELDTIKQAASSDASVDAEMESLMRGEVGKSLKAEGHLYKSFGYNTVTLPVLKTTIKEAIVKKQEANGEFTESECKVAEYLGVKLTEAIAE